MIATLNLLNPIQEAQENTIRFPEDSPDALRAVVMWLYSFDLRDCYRENDVTNGRNRTLAVVIPEMHDLAAKYDLPDLTLEIEVSISDDLGSGGVLFNYFWPMARYLWSNPESAVRLRKIFLLRLRAYTTSTKMMQSDRVFAMIKTVPGVAYDLLVSGGLDGKGPKVVEEVVFVGVEKQNEH